MTDVEVNKIIAEFMGYKYYPTHSPCPVFVKNNVEYMPDIFEYDMSLDALVPVWEKLGVFEFRGIFECQSAFFKLYDLPENIRDPRFIMIEEGTTIQQVAAHATAKAILKLNKDSK